ncbi:hypothetical protein CEUSTIGMA_g2020.t1 [Chlamydomonas eustigma]|uniref:RAP domain-containing protein n=1 Tax=Chlamydomonas eustigma TaxID=1157962 RepID=A0A250WUT5_9CHLO|nr:hypothetical protein CEUSTIGMA_g2020.t1 [Chlamydomonas eustigma]|eukprot:GAX74571.1 hypothetical protein CEUSTIGMA_g2020.t1 [Chlamydomonas eustigma]
MGKYSMRTLPAILSSLAWLDPAQKAAQDISSHETSLRPHDAYDSQKFNIQDFDLNRLFLQLAHTATRIIFSATADDAVRILWALAKLGVQHNSCTEAASEAVLQGAWQQDVLSNSTLSSAEVAEQKLHVALMPPRLLPSLMWSLAHCKPCHLMQPSTRQLLEVLLGGSGREEGFCGTLDDPKCLKSIPIGGLVTLLYALGLMSKMQATNMEAEMGSLASSCTDSVSTLLERTSCIELICSELLARESCVAEIGGSSTEPFSDLSGHGKGSGDCGDYSSMASTSIQHPRSLSNIAWALCQLRHMHVPLLQRVEQLALQVLKPTSAKSAHRSVLPALGLRHSFSSRGSAKADGEGWQISAPHRAGSTTTMQPDQSCGLQLFRPQELCALLVSFSRLQVRLSQALVSEVQSWVLRNHRLLSARDASELLYVMACHQSSASKRGTLQQRVASPTNLNHEVEAEFQASSPRPSLGNVNEGETHIMEAAATTTHGENLGVNTDSPLCSGKAEIDKTAEKALHQLYQVAARNLQLCSPQQIIGLVWALARLGRPQLSGILTLVLSNLKASYQQLKVATDESFMPPRDETSRSGVVGSDAMTDVTHQPRTGAVLPPCKELLPLAALNPEDVARLCWSIARTWQLRSHSGLDQSEDSLKIKDSVVLELLDKEAMEWCPSMDNQSLVMVLWSYATLGHPCPSFLEASSKQARLRLPTLSSHHTPLLLWSLAKLLRCSRNSSIQTNSIGQTGSQLIPSGLRMRDLDSPYGCNLSDNLKDEGTRGIPPSSGFLMQRPMSAVSSPSLVIMGIAPFELFKAIEGLLIQQMMQHTMSSRGAVMIAWAYASSGMQPGVKLTRALALSISSKAGMLDAHSLGLACWALSRLDCSSKTAVLKALSEEALSLLAKTNKCSVAQIPIQGYEMGQDCEGSCQPEGPSMSMSSLSAITVALARSHALSPQLLSATVSFIYNNSSPLGESQGDHIRGLHAEEAVQLLWVISTAVSSPSALRVRGSALMHVVCMLMQTIYNSLFLATAQDRSSGNPLHCSRSAKQCQARSSLEGQESKSLSSSGELLSMFFIACSALGFHPGQRTLDKASKQLLLHVSTLSSHTLCDVLSALASLNASSQEVQEHDSSKGRVPSEQHDSTQLHEKLGASGERKSVKAPKMDHLKVTGKGWSGAIPAEGALDGGGNSSLQSVVAMQTEDAKTKVPMMKLPTSASASDSFSVIRVMRPSTQVKVKYRIKVGSVTRLVRAAAVELTKRLCDQQQEMLTLGSALKLGWALSCFPTGMVPGTMTGEGGKQRLMQKVCMEESNVQGKYSVNSRKFAEVRRLKSAKKGATNTLHLSYAAPRLQLYIAAKVFSCPPDSLNERPPDLRKLLEMKSLMQAELVPRSSWRALYRRWERNVQQAGLPDRMPPGLLPLTVPLAERQRERLCASQVQDSLTRLGLGEGLTWGFLPEGGDRVCTFEAWSSALTSLPVQRTTVSLDTSPLPPQGDSVTTSYISLISSSSKCRQRNPGLHLSDVNSEITGSGLIPNASQAIIRPVLRRQELNKEVVNTVGGRLPPQGGLPVRARTRNKEAVSRRFALYLISPSHLLMHVNGEALTECASSLIRSRLLRNEGCFAAIMGVNVDQWLRMRPHDHDQVLKSLLKATLESS